MLSKHSRVSDKTPRSNSADPLLDESMHLAHEMAEQSETENPIPKPIVSIHGRDVREEDLDSTHHHRRRNHRKAA